MSNAAEVHDDGFSFEQAANLSADFPASMTDYFSQPGMIRVIGGGIHLSNTDQLADFICGSPVAEAARIAEVRSTIYSAYWGRKLFDAAFPQVPATTGKLIRTVRLTLRQLGFKRPVTLSTVVQRARQCGLAECPHFVAYHYRLRYIGQPLDETLYILTKSVDIGDGELSLFGLHHRRMYASNDYKKQENILWMDGHDGQPNLLWSSNSEWVFAIA